MTTIFKWVAGEGAQNGITTGLDSLGDGNTAISAAIDNLTDLYEYIDLELYLAQITGIAPPYVSIWILYSLDGTNYEDGSAGTPGTLPVKQPDAIIPIAEANVTSRKIVTNIPIAPLKFKILLQNSTGAAFAASGNTLKYNRHNEQVV